AWPTMDPSSDGIPHTGVPVKRGDDGRWVKATAFPPAIAAAIAAAPKEPPTPPEYHQDPRFNARMDAAGEGAPAQALLKQLHERTKAQRLVQGAWLKKPVPVSVRSRTAAQVMDDLARLARGKWTLVGPVWVLAPQKESGSGAR